MASKMENEKKACLALDYFKDLPRPFARNEDELLRCIKNINHIVSEEDYQEKYRKLIDTFHVYQDGKSKERLFNCLTKGS